jgi:Sortilin, neurotensin receptor 3,/Sortilin, neurotensin receptor 3, C-terminal
MSFHSNISSGMVLAMGNVGDRLLDIEKGNLYMTIDGGKSWNEIAKGRHIWAVGNFGGLVVIAPTDMTTGIQYSWNLGEDWSFLKISETPIKVTYAFTNPSSESLSISVIGHNSASSTESLFFSLDFAPLFDRVCSNEDFENWSVGECSLGSDKSFNRRKTGSVCRIAPTFEHSVPATKKCQCTKSDFECE